MRIYAKIFVCILIAFLSDHYSQGFYSIDKINEIEIVFKDENWNEILDSYWRKGEEERLLCNVLINGISFSNVGARYKGYSSYNRTYLKKPLNIKLDYIVAQSYQGVETIKLSNGFRDPSFVREILAYDIFRKYMPASRANYVNLIINGIYEGVYISVEPVDKRFIKEHFRENNGPLFKGDPSKIGFTFTGNANFKYLGLDSTLYYDSYELKSDNGWSELIQMINILNNDIENIENYLNVDQLLWFAALNNIIVNLDSPINVFRNFYLYQDVTGRFNIIPWDLNMAFGNYKSIAGISGSISEINLQTLDPFHNSNNSDFPLINKILTIPRFKKIYFTHLKTVLEQNFTNNWYLERASKVQEIISTSVYNDNLKFYSDQDFKDNVSYTIGNSSIYTIGIQELMKERINFIEGYAEYQLTSPDIIGLDHSPLKLNPGDTLEISVSSYNTDKMYFSYRNSLYENFKRHEMNSASIISNDELNRFDLSLILEPGETQYYITAENSNSISFYPNSAEYKFNIFPVSGDLVINEILSSNSKTATDEEGEYDDFIELYNSTDKAINLNDYYLSDKSDNLTKWKLPNIDIAANDYLIIWADEDSEQGILHSNFKLSAEGEDLFLSYSDSVIIDMVSYGRQLTDISYGRIPNGVGQFVQLIPSVSKRNQSPLDEKNILYTQNFQLEQNYPNPFNSSTVIVYQILEDSKIDLSVYNTLGQRVAKLEDGFKASGNYNVPFNASELSTGIYFYRLSADNYSDTKKMLLLK